MDNYIQESVEAERFILWKNSQGSERKKVSQWGGIRKTRISLFVFELNQT